MPAVNQEGQVRFVMNVLQATKHCIYPWEKSYDKAVKFHTQQRSLRRRFGR